MSRDFGHEKIMPCVEHGLQFESETHTVYFVGRYIVCYENKKDGHCGREARVQEKKARRRPEEAEARVRCREESERADGCCCGTL